jgi:hypothetical protein
MFPITDSIMNFKVSVFVACCFVSSLSFGQKMDSFDEHVADYRLLQSKKIQAEMGITEAQRSKLNAIANAQRAEVIPYLQQLQKQGKTSSELESDQKYLGYVLKYRNEFLLALSPKQLQRLRELSLQNVDLAGALDIIVSKRIGMTADQLKRARDAYGVGMKQSQAIMMQVNQVVTGPYKNVKVTSQAQAKSINEAMQKAQAIEVKKHEPEITRIQAETKKRILAVMTPKQIAAYRALQGKKFSQK